MLRKLLVDGSVCRFGSRRVSGVGFWLGLEPNRPVLALQTWTFGGLPGPVANTSVGQHSDPQWPWVMEYSDLHQTGVVVVPWWMVHSQIWIIW